MSAHQMEPIEGPPRTYRCTRCAVGLTGVTERDLVHLQTEGMAHCSGLDIPTSPWIMAFASFRSLWRMASPRRQGGPHGRHS